MKTFKVKKILPMMFLAYEKKPLPEAEISSVEELLKLDFVKSWTKQPSFVRFSLWVSDLSKDRIIVEFKNSYQAIASIEYFSGTMIEYFCAAPSAPIPLLAAACLFAGMPLLSRRTRIIFASFSLTLFTTSRLLSHPVNKIRKLPKRKTIDSDLMTFFIVPNSIHTISLSAGKDF